MKRPHRNQHEKGYRKAVATMARLLGSAEWDAKTRPRLKALVQMMATFAKGKEALDASEFAPKAPPTKIESGAAPREEKRGLQDQNQLPERGAK